MSSPVRAVVVVPSALTLLPQYAGAADPVPELRVACSRAVSWLIEHAPSHVEVIAAPPRPDNLARGVNRPAGVAIARHLLAEAGFQGTLGAQPAAGVLVVANGSATRGEKAPGHLDARAFGFDDTLAAALRGGDATALGELDRSLAEELWCFDAPAWGQLATLVRGPVGASIDYEDDPYGVQYWVARWACAS